MGPDALDIGYGEELLGIDVEESTVIVRTSKHTYQTRAALIADRHPLPDWSPPGKTLEGPRIHVDVLPEHVENLDVLIVGYTDHAVELTATAAGAGARVVLAAGGMKRRRLSPAGDAMLHRLEQERRATIM